MVCISAVLAMVGVHVFNPSLDTCRLDGTVKRLRADLSLARCQAMMKQKTLKVTFNTTTSTYQIPGLPDFNRRSDPNRVYVVDLAGEPYGATLVSVDLGGDNEISFDAYGTPDSGGTITISRGGKPAIAVPIDPNTGTVWAGFEPLLSPPS